jgi:hypothetical protein
MLHLHKINPMVRAIGTMGAVAGLVAGITFAQTLNSNQVKLTNDTISTPSLGLAVAPATAGVCPLVGDASWTTSMQGMQIKNLNSTPATYTFCLQNNSDSGSGPEAVTMTSAAAITSTGIAPTDVTLKVSCNGGTAVGGTLDTFSPTDTFVVDGAFAQGTVDTCTATATLNPLYSGMGGSVNPFELDFVGTQS